LRHFNNAIHIDPSFQEALNDIGVCFDNLDMLDKALESFNKILKIELTNKLALYNKGAVFIKLKKFDKTSEMITKLLELDANYARAYYLRACLNSVQNNISEAIKEPKFALNLDKNLINDAKTDPDLKNIKDINEFMELLRDFD